MKEKSLTIGFVPTMGALHEGHISLIRQSTLENDLTVCSIFVNPTQFNDKNDFDKYPITLEEDIRLLALAKTDVLFIPSVAEIYPNGTDNLRAYDIGFLNTILDGIKRPGHFNGVCNVVHVLLNMVKPNMLYLGEKDFQQCLVLKQLVIKENLPVKVICCPTLRAEDGLALSSRNKRLLPEQRAIAGIIYECLQYVKTNQQTYSFSNLQQYCLEKLANSGFSTEYLLLANADTLHLMDNFCQDEKMVVLIAAKLGDVRLIDNLRLN